MKLPNWRNLFRFRLRTLLLAMTVASIWLGLHVHSARMQERSVAAIHEYGGWVRYDYQFPAGAYSPKDFDDQARSAMPKWLVERLWQFCFSVRSLYTRTTTDRRASRVGEHGLRS